jgi:hypothetical protein
MQDDSATYIRNLVRRLGDQRQPADRFLDLLRGVSRAEPNLATVAQAFLAFTKESTGDYLRGLARIEQNSRKARNDLSREYGSGLLNRLHATSAGPTGEADHQEAEVTLTGPIGGRATAPFVIENVQTQQVEITFIVSEFTDLSGHAPFRPPLRIEPKYLLLGPGEKSVVTLHLPLLAELFVPGRLYQATVTVRGPQLELLLHALAYQVEPLDEEVDALHAETNGLLLPPKYETAHDGALANQVEPSDAEEDALRLLLPPKDGTEHEG